MKPKVSIKLVIATIFIYLAGLFAGLTIIWAIPYTRYISHMESLSIDLAQEYLTTWKTTHSFSGMDYFLYSKWNTKVYASTQYSDAVKEQLIDKNLDEIIEKGTVVKPVRLTLSSTGSQPTSGTYWALLVGVAYNNDTDLSYASILVRIFPELDTSLITYFIIFTLIYIIGALYMFYYIRKSSELNQIQRDLVANVSHELKTPITTIHSMAEVLDDELIDDVKTKKQYTGMILSEAERLASLVDDILKLSRLQSHRLQFNKTECYANGILIPVFDRYMMLCMDAGKELNLNQLDLDSLPALYTDPEKICNVFDILLSNAFKYTDENGIICVTMEAHTHYVEFCVSDNGVGIAPEKVKHIFDRFYRADESRNTPGSGLGLAIADEIIKGLDERIWVRSEDGVGSQFYFTVSFKN